MPRGASQMLPLLDTHLFICSLILQYVRLGTFVHYMRFYAKNGKLSQDRIDRLNELDFSWNVADDRWNTKYDGEERLQSLSNFISSQRLPRTATLTSFFSLSFSLGQVEGGQWQLRHPVQKLPAVSEAPACGKLYWLEYLSLTISTFSLQRLDQLSKKALPGRQAV